MKVLSISTYDASGGAAKAAYRIHRSILDFGVSGKMLVKTKMTEDKTVIPISSFFPSNPIFPFWNWVENKIKNKCQHFKWNRYPDREDVFLSDLRSIRFFDALQKIDFDILHLNWFNLRFFDMNLLKEVRKPIVWTLHDSWAFCGICHIPYQCDKFKTSCGTCALLHSESEDDLSKEIFNKKKSIYDQLDLHIVTPSNWLAHCAAESFLLGRFPIQVIPNPIDTRFFKPTEKKMSSKKHILFGAMNVKNDRNKGLCEFEQALGVMEKILDTSSCQVDVFGTDETIFNDVSFDVVSHGVIRNDEEMVKLYNLADVMVVPSLSENLSYTIMESMSCGTPVVAFRIGGNIDLIDHMKNGYLVDEKEKLAEGIQWCLDHNDDGILGRAARKKVISEFDGRRVGKMYEDLFSTILVKNEIPLYNHC